MNLNQITLPSLNVEKTVLYYKKLGFRLIVEAFPRYARFECLDGTATFSIHLKEKINENSEIIIYFEVENVDEKVRELTNKGINFDALPEDKPWLWREAYLKDPDGNQIIIYHAGGNRRNPPWRIN